MAKCKLSLLPSKLGGVHSNEAEGSYVSERSAVLSPLRYCCECDPALRSAFAFLQRRCSPKAPWPAGVGKPDRIPQKQARAMCEGGAFGERTRL